MNPTIVATMDDMAKRTENGEIVTDTSGRPVLDEEKWLEFRETAGGKVPTGHCIGGSESAQITKPDGSFGGCSHWGSPFTLARKKMRIKETVKESDKSDIFFVGHWMEQPVAERASEMIAEREGLTLKLVNDTRMFQSPTAPHAIADLDRLLKYPDGHWEGLEIKTTRTPEAWDPYGPEAVKGVPAYYYIQIQHYMAVTGLPAFWIACQNVSNLAEEPIIRRVARDDSLCEKILSNIEYFVKEIESGNLFDSPEYASDPVAYSRATARYADTTAKVQVDIPSDLFDEWEKAQQEVIKATDKLTFAQTVVDNAVADRTAVENKIGALFKGKEGFAKFEKEDGTVVSIDYALQRGRASFDLEKMKKEAPALYDRIVKLEPKAAAYSSLKGDDKAEAAKFRVEPIKLGADGEPAGWNFTVKYPKAKK